MPGVVPGLRARELPHSQPTQQKNPQEYNFSFLFVIGGALICLAPLACENLRFSAVFCANLRLPNPLIYRAQSEPKISENLQKSAKICVPGPVSPFCCLPFGYAQATSQMACPVLWISVFFLVCSWPMRSQSMPLSL